MASIAARKGGRGRRLASEINVVPYIDVMLVLLVIFMVTAPLVPPGTIDLPRAGRSNVKPDAYVEVQVRADSTLQVRTVNAGESQWATVTRRDLGPTLARLRGSQDVPVMISGDAKVPYEAVMGVLDEVKGQNVSRVGLMVKPLAAPSR
jgi:biopolymer transport protein TolR